MESFTLYLVKSAVWLAGFSLVYYLFLQNEKFFRLKRYFLLAGILGSVVFPLITVRYGVELPAGPAVSPGVTNSAASVNTYSQPVSGEGFKLSHLLIIIYFAGIIFLALRTIAQMAGLLRFIYRKRINNEIQSNIIRSSEFRGSFSFFNYIFIHSAVNDQELEAIMKHELVHVNEKHWFDLLLADLIRLIQWINPFAWIYNRFIRQNHEYIADEMALQTSRDAAVYKAVLMNQLLGVQVISLSNSFNYSINKKRFEMMKKTIWSPYRRMKIFLIAPVVGLIFYAFAAPEYHYSERIDSPGLSAGNQDPVKIRNNDRFKHSPLIVIDGTVSTRKQEEIDPEEIASINILKDEPAIEKYGKKGRNGVIEITTKSKALKAEGSGHLTIAQKRVKGVVVNENGQPMEKVIITTNGISGEEAMVTTDKNGMFEIDNVEAEASLLVVSTGFKRLVVKPDFVAGMNIRMEKDPDIMNTQQRGGPLVVVDGEISDLSYSEAIEKLGYDLGVVQGVAPEEALKKYGDRSVNGVVEITTRKKAISMGLKPPYPRLTDNDFPTFQGKKWFSFKDWVRENVKYPEKAKARNAAGWVNVNFQVELDGSVTNPVVVGSADPDLSEEVIRVIKTSPRWDPPKNPAIDSPFTGSVNIGFRAEEIMKEEPFVVVEQMPMYPGGEIALLQFVADNTVYPEEAKARGIQGKVIIRFIVNTDGNTEGISILKGIDPLLDEEAIRVVSLISGFSPGMQGGKPVPVWYMIPINFTVK